MDTRIKFKEVIQFIKYVKSDYDATKNEIVKRKKKKAFIKTIKLTINQFWSLISAPLIYPIWYIFRKQITNAIYENSSWEEVHRLVEANKILEAKEIVKRKGLFLYWLWTYGDLKDPLGKGELPDDFYGGRYKNNFIGRYYENAIRNPRFTINYINYRSGNIIEKITISDTRDFNIITSSEGLGDAPIGMLFNWFIDDKGEYYFIYDDNNLENLFYYGYTGLSRDYLNNNGRFEIGYRKN